MNKKTENALEYIEIVVKASSYPVSYHGEFHYRSGSTKQQLTGMALSEFIMRKTGTRWEDGTVDTIGVEDLDDESFKIFRREALRRKRMTEDELNISNKELLDKLHLLSPDGKLKRSAVLLFYRDPSVVQNGSFVQIGKFGKGPDLQYQDLLEGSLITTADKIVDLIYLKYLKAKVSFEHDRRLETYPFARDAVREAVFNAIVHNCYMYGTQIQIRIDDNSMVISNSCILPENWSVETFMQTHNSKPYNPDIAGVFYRAGYIERWGRGIEKICNACKELGAELPVYEMLGNTLRVHFKALPEAIIDEDVGVNEGLKRQNDALNDALALRIIEVLRKSPSVSQENLAEELEVARRTVQRKMEELKEEKIIERKGGKRFGYWEVHLSKNLEK